METTPEQLAAASQRAELAAASTGVTTRLIGWYHSHPHITVLPSAVGVCGGACTGCAPRSLLADLAPARCAQRCPCAADVRTQSTYQLLDEGFVGLIFSVFDQGRDKARAATPFATACLAHPLGVAGWPRPGCGISGGGGAPGRRKRLARKCLDAAERRQRAHAPPRTVARRSLAAVQRYVCQHPLRAMPDELTRFLATAWPHRLAPLLELQRTLLAEETKAYADARAAAACDADNTSSGAVTGAAVAALHQCNVCALLSHGLAPLLCTLSARLAQSRFQTSALNDTGDAAIGDAAAELL